MEILLGLVETNPPAYRPRKACPRRTLTQGVLILDVQPESKAAQASLRPTRRTRFGQIILGDIIIAINDAPIRDNKELFLTLEKHKVGDRVNVKVWRDGAESSVDVELEVAE